MKTLLDDRILVKPDAAAEKSAGGVMLPDTVKKSHVTGTVLQVGPGRLLENGVRAIPLVSVGDRVLYGRTSAMKLDDSENVILREADIIAVL